MPMCETQFRVRCDECASWAGSWPSDSELEAEHVAFADAYSRLGEQWVCVDCFEKRIAEGRWPEQIKSRRP